MSSNVTPLYLGLTVGNDIVPSGTNFDRVLIPGGSSGPIVTTRLGGFHFNDCYTENTTGTIIAVE